jgi:DNA-binding transcriptional LysR family regulator
MIRVGSRTAIRPIIDDALSAARVTLNWQYEVQNVETAVNLVEVGLGFAIVPHIDVVLHRGRGLVAVPLRGPQLSFTYGLVTRRGMPLSPPAASLRGYIIDEMKGRGGPHAPYA